ncbi:SMI1/KNR4 family protein [Streptomyces sp. NPDC002092]
MPAVIGHHRSCGRLCESGSCSLLPWPPPSAAEARRPGGQMKPRPISESWSRIECWLRDRERIRELAPAATGQDIAQAEEPLGVNLHPDHRQLLLGHNGSGRFALPPYYEILSTSEVVDKWRLKTDVWADQPCSPYRPHWVPFAADRAGGVLYLDVVGDFHGPGVLIAAAAAAGQVTLSTCACQAGRSTKRPGVSSWSP